MTDEKTFAKEDPIKNLNNIVPSGQIQEAVEPTSDGSITLTKDEFEAMNKRLERLEKVANKARISNYDNANKEEQQRIYKLRMIDGRVITHWSDLITNKVEINPINKKVEEDQKLEVFYEDGTSEKMDLILYNRRYQYIYCRLTEEVILRKKEDIEKYGDRKLKLEEVDSGKEYEVGVKFVN